MLSSNSCLRSIASDANKHKKRKINSIRSNVLLEKFPERNIAAKRQFMHTCTVDWVFSLLLFFFNVSLCDTPWKG